MLLLVHQEQVRVFDDMTDYTSHSDFLQDEGNCFCLKFTTQKTTMFAQPWQLCQTTWNAACGGED